MAEDMNIGRLPVPDPTVLTTEALIREINHLRELTKAERRADVSEIEALARAHDKHHEGLDRLRDSQHRALVDQVAALKELLKEALAARDQALTAALSAAKEATSKAEAATTKQVDAMGDRFDVEIKAIKDQLGDVKTNAGAAGGRVAGKEYALGVALAIGLALLSLAAALFIR
jgi:phosphopantetheinyl transferase (holo-ACP synthase)